MQHLFSYILITVFGLMMAPGKLHAAEMIRMKDHPLQYNADLGVSMARIGEGRLHQLEVTIIEIPAGGQLPPSRHLSEEMLYIISGRGHTMMWTAMEQKKHKYQWQEGDFLSPSLNVWHQHVNDSSSEPARYLSVNTAPLTRNVFKNEALLSSLDFDFDERWSKAIAQEPRYTRTASEGPETVRMDVGHILRNLRDREMELRGREQLGITILPEGDMAGNWLLEMEVREFLNGDATTPHHRHFWETVYFILKGDGYVRLQRDEGPEQRVNWTEGDLFIVEANEYHTHRPGGEPGGRFVQMKASGYFRRVGLDDYTMQDKPKDD